MKTFFASIFVFSTVVGVVITRHVMATGSYYQDWGSLSVFEYFLPLVVLEFVLLVIVLFIIRKRRLQTQKSNFSLPSYLIVGIMVLLLENIVAINLASLMAQYYNQRENSKRISVEGWPVCYVDDIQQRELTIENLGLHILRPNGWRWAMRDEALFFPIVHSQSQALITKCTDYAKNIRMPYTLKKDGLVVNVWLDMPRKEGFRSIEDVLHGSESWARVVRRNFLPNLPNEHVLFVDQRGEATVFIENELCGKLFKIELLPRGAYQEYQSDFYNVLSGISLMKQSYTNQCPAFQPD